MTATESVKCLSCGAKIIWATDQSGTKIPLNFVRVRAYHPDGCFLELPHLHGKDGAEHDPEPHLMRVSHFTTCKFAAHSKKGGKDAT